jgi:nitrogen fixation/metabolism regulation signal transduction histidine kinase
MTLTIKQEPVPGTIREQEMRKIIDDIVERIRKSAGRCLQSPSLKNPYVFELPLSRLTLYRLLGNIIWNATIHKKDKGGQTKMDIVVAQDDRGAVVMQIDDNSGGISDYLLETDANGIYELTKFGVTGGSTETGMLGRKRTGVGMTEVYYLCKDNGIKLEISNTQRVGARFVLRFK